MADAAADHEKQVRRKFKEEQNRRKFHEEQSRKMFNKEHSKKLDYKKVEFTEHEFEKGAFECKKGEKKRKRKYEHLERKKIKVVEPNSFDEMLESVDALLTSLESPVARTINRENVPDVLAMSEQEYTSSPPTAIIEIAELDAHETAIPRPSTPTRHTGSKPTLADNRKKGKDIVSCKELIITPPVIDLTTALHSNPLSSTERAFARKLGKAHHAHRVVDLGNHELALPIFGEVTEYDGKGATAKKKKKTKTKKMKLSFSKAVSRGFKEIFGEESCFG